MSKEEINFEKKLDNDTSNNNKEIEIKSVNKEEENKIKKENGEKKEKQEEIHNIIFENDFGETKENPKNDLNRKKENKDEKSKPKNKKEIIPNFFEINKEKIKLLVSPILPKDKTSIQKSILNHVNYTLGTHYININNETLFFSTSSSVKNILQSRMNKTEEYIIKNNPKKIHYMSIEFLLGRLLQNSLVCLEMENNYKEALFDLGIKLEELYEKEKDPALGNGGLGRLAACYMDSLSTMNYPGYGYGIRYDYGIFKQAIQNFEQKELPDYWLQNGNPWEIMRLDTKYTVRFYGYCRDSIVKGKKYRKWCGGDEIIAIPYDIPIPGFKTYNCNTLRLWKSFPKEEFNFDMFNKGDFSSSINDKNTANYITSVLYPNDNSLNGRELRLKQEYFFCSATIQDIIKKFKKLKLPWKDFPKYNCIQLNDTHPTLAIIELLRILMDEYYLEYKDAFKIVKKSFNYTNHTVLPEALEKWGTDIFKKILPRHLELIFLVNYMFLEEIKIKYPNDNNKLSIFSIIEESTPKQIRMANLCIISSTKVNGVAKIHSNLIRKKLFKDFYELYPKKFTNVTNGVTPRRWIHCSFPELSNLLTEYNNNKNDWLSELDILLDLPSRLEKDGKKEEFMKKYKKAKLAAKLRLKNWVKKNCDIIIDENFMFDIMVKRIHEYKRQFLNCLYCIYKYLTIKKMTFEEKLKLNKRVTFFGGKSAPGYILAKNTIKLINMIAQKVNNDKEVNPYFKIIFLPDYKVSTAEIIIPGADISQHISTAGAEASGTSCMKFVMTGSIILGTRDGANIEIEEEIGENNIFLFGKKVEEVNNIRDELKNGKKNYISKNLKECFDALYKNEFGDSNFIHDYLNCLSNGGDYYCTCHDFDEYIKIQEKVDEEYKDKEKWDNICFENICHMGFFSSDRCVQNYANDIWKIKPIEIPCSDNEIS